MIFNISRNIIRIFIYVLFIVIIHINITYAKNSIRIGSSIGITSNSKTKIKPGLSFGFSKYYNSNKPLHTFWTLQYLNPQCMFDDVSITPLYPPDDRIWNENINFSIHYIDFMLGLNYQKKINRNIILGFYTGASYSILIKDDSANQLNYITSTQTSSENIDFYFSESEGINSRGLNLILGTTIGKKKIRLNSHLKLPFYKISNFGGIIYNSKIYIINIEFEYIF